MRRREMARQAEASPFPIFVDVPMTYRTIINGGKITSKTDWRSSGYVAFPDGATGVIIHNYSSNRAFRGGRPTSDTQTTGIAMMNSGSAIDIANGGSSGPWLNTTGWIYLSRQGTDQSAITLEFVDT